MKEIRCNECYNAIEEHNEKYFENTYGIVICGLCMSSFEEKQFKIDFVGESIELLNSALKTLSNCETSYDADDKVAEALKLLKQMKEEDNKCMKQ